MRGLRSGFWLLAVGALLSLVGCLTTEVRSASDALEAARRAGKDKECPSDFQAAEALVHQAVDLCNSCQTVQANALAAQAMAKTSALCPAKPAPPAPPAAPTASLSASPSSVEAGSCANLTWSTTGASSVSIDQGVGGVDTSGSRQVCPSSTTRYTLTASGSGGSRSDSATVTVAAKAQAPPPPAPAKPTDQITIHVNFDFNKSDIKKSELADLQKAEAFVKKYSKCRIEIDGHTDSIGSEAYNMKLSERRADAVEKWLLDHGATASDHITTKGYGKTKPIASNKTAKGRAENRRAEILAFCE